MSDTSSETLLRRSQVSRPLLRTTYSSSANHGSLRKIYHTYASNEGSSFASVFPSGFPSSFPIKDFTRNTLVNMISKTGQDATVPCFEGPSNNKTHFRKSILMTANDRISGDPHLNPLTADAILDHRLIPYSSNLWKVAKAPRPPDNMLSVQSGFGHNAFLRYQTAKQPLTSANTIGALSATSSRSIRRPGSSTYTCQSSNSTSLPTGDSTVSSSQLDDKAVVSPESKKQPYWNSMGNLTPCTAVQNCSNGDNYSSQTSTTYDSFRKNTFPCEVNNPDSKIEHRQMSSLPTNNGISTVRTNGVLPAQMQTCSSNLIENVSTFQSQSITIDETAPPTSATNGHSTITHNRDSAGKTLTGYQAPRALQSFNLANLSKINTAELLDELLPIPTPKAQLPVITSQPPDTNIKTIKNKTSSMSNSKELKKNDSKPSIKSQKRDLSKEESTKVILNSPIAEDGNNDVTDENDDGQDDVEDNVSPAQSDENDSVDCSSSSDGSTESQGDDCSIHRDDALTKREADNTSNNEKEPSEGVSSNRDATNTLLPEKQESLSSTTATTTSQSPTSSDVSDDDVDSPATTPNPTPPQPQQQAQQQRPATDRQTAVPTSATGTEALPLLSACDLPPVQPGNEPPLTFSLFPYVPPVLNFVQEGRTIQLLPPELRRFLRWRQNTITPLILRKVLVRSGFRPSKMSSIVDDMDSLETHDWIVYFGRHMKTQTFKTIREHQKVNHFPGSFHLGRKDRLWWNLHRMQVQFGRAEFDFIPQTFCLPADIKLLRQTWDDGGYKLKWIVKPPAAARGTGIRVINKWSQIPQKKPIIVQKYISDPYLINDSKFDLRVYVFVTSFDPLKIYIHDDGLVRFASFKYSSSAKSINNKFMHLTNYSINKLNSVYVENVDCNACQGHKWSLRALWTYLAARNVDTKTVWSRIKDVVIKTIISGEAYIASNVKQMTRRRYCVSELFGFDILLDEALNPWILEVNISPSLHSNSPLDAHVKGQVVTDMLNIAGYQIPDPQDLLSSCRHISSASCSNNSGRVGGSSSSSYPGEPASDLTADRRLWDQPLSTKEREKHISHLLQPSLDGSIVDNLTPGDLRQLVELLDEEGRVGDFERIFPTCQSGRYVRYFEQRKYFNLLLVAYLQRYEKCPKKGIDMVRRLCQKKLHLVAERSNRSEQHGSACAPSGDSRTVR